MNKPFFCHSLSLVFSFVVYYVVLAHALVIIANIILHYSSYRTMKMATSPVKIPDLKITSVETITVEAMTDKVSVVVITIEEEDSIIEEGDLIIEEEVVAVSERVSETMATKEVRGIRRLISRVVMIKVDLVIEETADLEVEVEVAEDSTEVEDRLGAETEASIEAEVVIIIAIAVVTSTEAEDIRNRSERVVAMVHKIRKLNLTTKL